MRHLEEHVPHVQPVTSVFSCGVEFQTIIYRAIARQSLLST